MLSELLTNDILDYSFVLFVSKQSLVLKNRSNKIRSNEIRIRRELPVQLISAQDQTRKEGRK